MEKYLEKIKRIFVYAGLEKQEYADIREEICLENETMLSKSTYIAVFLFFGLFLFSGGDKSIGANKILYSYIFMGLVLLLASQHMNTKLHSGIVLLRCYFLLLLAYGYGILVGVLLHRDIPSPTFCVLLFAAGFILTDRPYRLCLFLILLAGVFCTAVYFTKMEEIARIDILNAICFTVLCILTNTYLIHTKARNLLHAKNSQREMDTDGLTRLLVKKAAEREIRKYISATRETGALIIIDLDNFKQVNDTKGHAYGDVVLKVTGDSISAVFRSSDICGRFGGDEFVIFLPGLSDRKIVMERLDKFRELMRRGLTGEENPNGVGQSIGIAMYPEDGEDYQSLFEKADEALYEAKKRGKNQYCFYTSVKITKGNQSELAKEVEEFVN